MGRSGVLGEGGADFIFIVSFHFLLNRGVTYIRPSVCFLSVRLDEFLCLLCTCVATIQIETLTVPCSQEGASQLSVGDASLRRCLLTGDLADKQQLATG